jgi:hypothetical protein
VGSEATALWHFPKTEEGFRALVEERNASEEKLVSA